MKRIQVPVDDATLAEIDKLRGAARPTINTRAGWLKRAMEEKIRRDGPGLEKTATQN